MRKIFFDLDGTLIDASDRLYRLFCDLIPECNFSKEEYWNLKRQRINHKMIIEQYFPEYSFEEFDKQWMSLIETDSYLNLDKIYDGNYVILDKLQKTNELYLLTARQSKEKLTEELKKFKLQKYFKKILLTENKKTKADLLQETELNENDIFVTDMGKDIQISNDLGLKSIAVTWGFMDKNNLFAYNPEYIYDKIEELDTLND